MAPLLLALLFILPAPASASSTQQLIMEDEHRLLEFGAAEQERVLAEMDQLGVDKIRTVVWWRFLLRRPNALRKPRGNPASPNSRYYDPERWQILDRLVRETRRRGIELMLNPAASYAFPTSVLQLPAWARERDGSPKVGEFARFVAALGRRYSGHYRPRGSDSPLPAVREWSIWNEPNADSFLHPQWKTIRGRRVAWSPVLYRRIYNAAARALRRTGHRNGHYIYFGETTSTGAAESGPFASISPGFFVRELTCLDKNMDPYRGAAARVRECENYRPLDTNGLNTHLYSAQQGTAPATRLDDRDVVWTPGDPARPSRLIYTIAKRHHLPPGLPVYNTEAGFQSHPLRPALNAEEQGLNLNLAEYMQWRDPGIQSFAQYLLYDDPFWFTGLKFIDGQPKFAFYAFRMPIVVRDAGNGNVRIWGANYGRTGGKYVEIWRDGLLADSVASNNPRGYIDVSLPEVHSGASFFLRDPATGARSRTATVTPGL